MAPLSAPTMVLVLAAVLLACSPQRAAACSVTGMSVTRAGMAAKPADLSAYTLQDVDAHFKNMPLQTKMADNLKSTFTCVDARTPEPSLATPGGDYAELADALFLFFQQTGIKPNATSVAYIFKAFMDKVASPSRKFYYHTDESKLSELFKAVASAGIKPKPIAFPVTQPSNPKDAKIWYDYLSKPEFQGCGHVRLMLYKHREYGMPSAYIAEELIRQFFAYWWATPLGSPQRSKIDFVIKRGPLSGKAVAIVVNEGPACTGQTPLSVSAHGGSSVFMYHQTAVADFRAKVLAPLLADVASDKAFWGAGRVAFDAAKFVKEDAALSTAQLGFTLNNLNPADHVHLYKVSYKVTGGSAPAITQEAGAKKAVQAPAPSIDG